MLLPPPVNISKASTTYKGMLITIHFPGDLKTSLGIMGVNGAGSMLSSNSSSNPSCLVDVGVQGQLQASPLVLDIRGTIHGA